jgi:DNA-binding SARP family transcriptional activator
MVRALYASNGLRQDAASFEEVFDSLPAAVLVVDDTGCVTASNEAARALFGAALGMPGIRCCDVAGCHRGGFERPLAYQCVTAAVLESRTTLHGLDCEVDGQRIAITAAPLPAGDGVVLHAQPVGGRSDAVPLLRVAALGGLRLEVGDDPLNGEWLHHRPGQLLKYLICARGHRVPVEELVEALWPNSGRAGVTSLRQAVHSLRDRLEPNRAKHTPSRFVVGRPGGYELDMANVVIDADVFESEANAALLILERSGHRAAEARLTRAARLYGGEFLPDELYSDWALAERDRLRELATRVLRAHGDSYLAADHIAGAYSAFQRLADLDPLDPDAQARFIELMLRRGRHADAARRYEHFRRKFVRAFSYEPGFTLGELAMRAAGTAAGRVSA